MQDQLEPAAIPHLPSLPRRIVHEANAQYFLLERRRVLKRKSMYVKSRTMTIRQECSHCRFLGELKRCITILPAVTMESMRDLWSRSIHVEAELRKFFGIMEKRYEPFRQILEEISPEEACDILLSFLGSRNVHGHSPLSLLTSTHCSRRLQHISC